mmetsp:Transcript_21604/g.33791  ORF Transcript_21604/g.33791 Transcript_21604/m.33791 type:complete len:99 (-) Transcript_21604:1066-1362(-)
MLSSMAKCAKEGRKETMTIVLLDLWDAGSFGVREMPIQELRQKLNSWFLLPTAARDLQACFTHVPSGPLLSTEKGNGDIYPEYINRSREELPFFASGG